MDMIGDLSNVIFFFPSGRYFTDVSGMFEIAVRFEERVMDNEKVAFTAGSSQHLDDSLE